MNTCICCGMPDDTGAGFHKRCARRLFGVTWLPEVGLTLAELSLSAQKMAGKLSVSGVQPKMSLKLNTKARTMEVVAEQGEYILKPQVQTLPNLPQNENLCMCMAAGLGIEVPAHALMKLPDGSYAYIVRRFDRREGEKIHQEDFAQILGKDDKYQGSYEEIGKKILQVSDAPGLDVQLFYERVLFNFIIGNGDAHMKNFSVSYGRQGEIRLSPAYDIVSSKLVIPDEEDLALTLAGKKNNVQGRDFIRFAQYLDIPLKAVENKFLDQQERITAFIDTAPFLSEKERTSLKKIIQERIGRLR